MKMKGFILLFFAIFALNSCNSDDEGNIPYCESGPLGLTFELLDKTTGENLFTNGTFNKDDIKVIDLDDPSKRVNFIFNTENDINLIGLGPFGWGTNVVNYSLKVGEGDIFTLHLDAEKKTEDGCSFVQINKLEIENAEYTLDSQSGVYGILVEL
jgi:hypothetical protein